MIVIGVDAHKQTHTAAALDGQTARAVGEVTGVAREPGHEELIRWGRSLAEERLWALEDCRQVTGALERLLLWRGERVVRVAPKLAATHRRTAKQFGKSDRIDAQAVARAAVRDPDLPVARMAGPEREIALLGDHRDDLVAEATRHSNRLRWLLHDLDPALEPPRRSLWGRRILENLARQLDGRGYRVQVRICRDLVARLLELRGAIVELERELARLVARRARPLLEVPGCGVLMAAKILAEVGDIDRFSSDAQLAIYAGAAPLDASSGQQQRHRLNRSGNRQLNYALHRIAVTQGRVHEPAREFLARKQAEGKSRMEALRALKRHLARAVWQALRAARERAIEHPIPSVITSPNLRSAETLALT